MKNERFIKILRIDLFGREQMRGLRVDYRFS